MTVEIFDLSGIPPYNQDDEATPPAIVTEFKARIRAADAILFATPEYNYSIPGVLKRLATCSCRAVLAADVSRTSWRRMALRTPS